MITVIQRVTSASVAVDGAVVGAIERGILALVAVERNDSRLQADRLADRVLGYRIFADDACRMNLTVVQTGGALLLVPQFTLAADTQSGNRPSFSPAAPPDEGARMFEYFADAVRTRYERVACGRFGANMQVELVNDGPVTFILRT